MMRRPRKWRSPRYQVNPRAPQVVQPVGSFSSCQYILVLRELSRREHLAIFVTSPWGQLDRPVHEQPWIIRPRRRQLAPERQAIQIRPLRPDDSRLDRRDGLLVLRFLLTTAATLPRFLRETGRCRFSRLRAALVWRSAQSVAGPGESCRTDPAPYWITSSAVANSASGMVRPSALAVLRFTAISNLVGACTGRSAGFSPLRMRST
jgi:hypothetical protein